MFDVQYSQVCLFVCFHCGLFVRSSSVFNVDCSLLDSVVFARLNEEAAKLKKTTLTQLGVRTGVITVCEREWSLCFIMCRTMLEKD